MVALERTASPRGISSEFLSLFLVVFRPLQLCELSLILRTIDEADLCRSPPAGNHLHSPGENSLLRALLAHVPNDQSYSCRAFFRLHCPNVSDRVCLFREIADRLAAITEGPIRCSRKDARGDREPVDCASDRSRPRRTGHFRASFIDFPRLAFHRDDFCRVLFSGQAIRRGLSPHSQLDYEEFVLLAGSNLRRCILQRFGRANGAEDEE